MPMAITGFGSAACRIKVPCWHCRAACTAAAKEIASLSLDDFSQVIEERDRIGFVILGTGKTQVWPEPSLRQLFDERRIGLEVMDTGAAVRTYNVLLAEKRPVAAALVSVDDPR